MLIIILRETFIARINIPINIRIITKIINSSSFRSKGLNWNLSYEMDCMIIIGAEKRSSGAKNDEVHLLKMISIVPPFVWRTKVL